MNAHDFVLFAMQITVMLACAVVFGQLMRRLGQPAVLGEIIGGILPSLERLRPLYTRRCFRPRPA